MIRHGLTLLELMVVVAVLGLVAASATLRMGDAYRRTQLRQAESSVESFDARVRRTARLRHTALEVEIKVGERLMIASQPSEGDGQLRLPLPKNVTIVRAITSREDQTHKPLKVRFDHLGRGDSYALLLTTPSGAERWLVFAGQSGQRINLSQQRQVKELFRALAKNRFDAN